MAEKIIKISLKTW